jgi:NhaC family Na+:H+ antiporter
MQPIHGKPIPWGWAILPIFVALVSLLIAVTFWSIPLFICLFTGFGLAFIISVSYGWDSKFLLMASVNSVKVLLPVFLILLFVGGMISVWITSGTVSALIYYGLSIFPPHLLVLAAFLMATVISMLLGTSIGTLSTVGIAFMTMASHVDISLGLMGGALISGAFIGDRTSPLSSSVHLNAAMTGTVYKRNLPHLLVTLVPVFILLSIAYGFAGYGLPDTIHEVIAENKLRIEQMTGGIHLWMLIPPTVILLSALLRQSTWRTLLWGCLSGSLVAIFLYQVPVAEWLDSFLYGAHVPSLGDTTAGGLGTVGGLLRMIEQLLIILAAGALYGVVEASGMLKTLMQGLMRHIQTPNRLEHATGWISLGAGAVGCNQAMAIMLPGKMLAPYYDEMGLPRTWLARSISDWGVVLSALIPWNLHAMLCSAALGIGTFQYAPYAALLYLLPLASFLRSIIHNSGNNFLKEMDRSQRIVR